METSPDDSGGDIKVPKAVIEAVKGLAKAIGLGIVGLAVPAFFVGAYNLYTWSVANQIDSNRPLLERLARIELALTEVQKDRKRDLDEIKGAIGDLKLKSSEASGKASAIELLLKDFLKDTRKP